MFGEDSWQIAEQDVQIDESSEEVTIESVDLQLESIPILRFLFSLGLAVFFLITPVPWKNEFTVPFAILYEYLVEQFVVFLQWSTLVFTGVGVLLTFMAILDKKGRINMPEEYNNLLDIPYWETTVFYAVVRFVGLLFLIMVAVRIGPDELYPGIVATLWDELIPIIIVVMSIGGVLVNLLNKLGGLEFIGTLAKPIMKPLFNLPGRSALDSLASIFSSSTIGLYITYTVFNEGGYNKRDVYTICSCFITTSVGSFIVIAGFTGVADLLPFLFLSWFLSLGITAVILTRIPPISRVPHHYISEPNTEDSISGNPRQYLRLAAANALDQAKQNTVIKTAYSGAVDGIKLVPIVASASLAFGYPLLLIFELTDVFFLLSAPLIPLIEALGIPNPEVTAISTFSVLIGALLSGIVAGGIGVEPMAGFFITIVATSHVLQLSSVIAIGVDMFQEVPLRLRDLILLSLMRLLILIVIAAGLTHVANFLGLFG